MKGSYNMDKHEYTLGVIGKLLEAFETQANEVKKAIIDSTEDRTLTERESGIFLTVFSAFIKAQDEIISKVIAKELMLIANSDHRKDPIS